MTRKRVRQSDKYNVTSIEKAIKLIGSAGKLSRKLDVSYQAVLSWKNGFAVPNAINCIRIEKVTKDAVKREDILPDYPWDELR
jgi:DNA-binding transcriptional regulator YdaS (Cro superfamily)